MNRPGVVCAAVAACLVALVQASGPAGSLPAELEQFFTKVGRFTAADLAALEAGRVISKVEAGSTDTEVVALAAVKIRASRDRVARYYGQMVWYVDGEITLASGRFSTPPQLSDVKALVLDREEIEALRTCKPGDCDLRVGASGIEKIRGAVDWGAAGAAERAQQLVRQSIVDHVAAYQARGDAALVTYTDRSQPVSLAEQWRSIVAGSPYFHQYHPAVRTYLAQYPRATLPGGRDILYWVKEDFGGLKPTISVVHAIVYDPPGQADRLTIVQKQIYASHYYDGSLAIATLASATEAGAPVTYLVYANRSRGDLLKGGFGGLKASVARSQVRKGAEGTLGTIKRVLEQAPE